MSNLIDRDYMLSQIEKAKAENRPFDYDSLIDFVKVLPNANKAELKKIKAEIKNEIILSEALFINIRDVNGLLDKIDELVDKRIKEIDNE